MRTVSRTVRNTAASLITRRGRHVLLQMNDATVRHAHTAASHAHQLHPAAASASAGESSAAESSPSAAAEPTLRSVLQRFHARRRAHTFADPSALTAGTPRPRSSAVLIGLFSHPRDGALHVLLTERPANMRSHAGDVALPSVLHISAQVMPRIEWR
jgi:hypothetical protein